jgi:hypothetical protein
MTRLVLCLASIVVFLSACESFGSKRPVEPIDTVSVRYDPYNYSMSAVEESARAACRAKGGEDVYPIDNQINTEEVRWAYMNFECY